MSSSRAPATSSSNGPAIASERSYFETQRAALVGEIAIVGVLRFLTGEREWHEKD